MKKNKTAVAILLIIVTILFAISIPSLATGTATVIKQDIKLRKSMDENSTILELIPKNEEIEIVKEEANNWYQVRYLKIRGYVRSDEIQIKDNKEETNTTKDNNNTVQEPTQPEEDTKEEGQQETIQVGDIVTVKKETNIRLRPLISSRDIYAVKSQEEITVIQMINKWSYVATTTCMGWLPTENLTKQVIQAPVPQSPVQEEPKQEPVTTKTGYISSTDVNFRKEATTTAEIISVFSKNAEITIMEEQGDWLKVSYQNQIGYVNKQFVSDKKVETTSRGTEERKEVTPIENQTANGKGEEIVAYAKQLLGSKYIYGGETPTKGFDCSGFTKYVFKQFGISLTHSATAQSKVGVKVEKEDLQLGDMVFFSDYRTYQGIGHCGIYIGDNQFIHASTEDTGVITSSLLKGSYVKRYVTATRVI